MRASGVNQSKPFEMPLIDAVMQVLLESVERLGSSDRRDLESALSGQRLYPGRIDAACGCPRCAARSARLAAMVVSRFACHGSMLPRLGENKRGAAAATPLFDAIALEALELATALLGGSHATGADIESHELVADQQSLSLHVGTKVTVGPPLRMADIMSETLRLAANVTYTSHYRLHFCVQNDLAGYRPRQTRNRTLVGVRNHAF